VNGATGYDPMDSNLEISKPIYKYFQNDKNQKSQPLKYFKRLRPRNALHGEVAEARSRKRNQRRLL